MESVFSFGCVNGVIDHSGNCNISINQMKVWLKVCCVRAEMHLDYFIPQNLLRDSYLLHSCWPCKMKCLKKSLFLKVLQFSFGLLGDYIYIYIRFLMEHLRWKCYNYSQRRCPRICIIIIIKKNPMRIFKVSSNVAWMHLFISLQMFNMADISYVEK